MNVIFYVLTYLFFVQAFSIAAPTAEQTQRNAELEKNIEKLLAAKNAAQNEKKKTEQKLSQLAEELITAKDPKKKVALQNELVANRRMLESFQQQSNQNEIQHRLTSQDLQKTRNQIANLMEMRSTPAQLLTSLTDELKNGYIDQAKRVISEHYDKDTILKNYNTALENLIAYEKANAKKFSGRQIQEVRREIANAKLGTAEYNAQYLALIDQLEKAQTTFINAFYQMKNEQAQLAMNDLLQLAKEAQSPDDKKVIQQIVTDWNAKKKSLINTLLNELSAGSLIAYMTGKMNPYAVLLLSTPAGPDQIEKAYQQLMRNAQYQTNKNAIDFAYTTLMIPEEKARIDLYLDLFGKLAKQVKKAADETIKTYDNEIKQMTQLSSKK